MSPPIGGPFPSVESLGRYFSIVGGLTTLVASALPVALFASGAPLHRPNLNQAVETVSSLGLQDFAALGLLVVTVGLVLHPFQFPLTQLLEGYWGPNPHAQRAARRSIEAHLRRYQALAADAENATSQAQQRMNRVVELGKVRDRIPSEGIKKRIRVREWQLKTEAAVLNANARAASSVLLRYPENLDEAMPTRLGNVLRRYERLAGAAFGLDAVTAAPHLVQLADDNVRGYVVDARSDLDLAVRMVLVWTWATVVGVAMLWQYDVWLVVPLTSFALAYVSYRGAVHAAAEYGTSLQVLTTLTKTKLYEALRVSPPPDSASEYQLNRVLNQLLQGVYKSIEYEGGDKHDG